MRALAKRYPELICAHIGYDERLAHMIQAGSDFIIQPSRFEPRGLTQLYVLRTARYQLSAAPADWLKPSSMRTMLQSKREWRRAFSSSRPTTLPTRILLPVSDRKPLRRREPAGDVLDHHDRHLARPPTTVDFDDERNNYHKWGA
ncbi:hypothetical protein [Rhizobium sp. AN5]|uniref:hypothetical protein n=1 Tax=Rhizobium sp. AN5 TaxID=1855304 RepID=UPI00117B06A1|nr:hypothetical protein [Rhizobium sp. AN5]